MGDNHRTLLSFLARRELQLVGLVARGLDNKEIAEELGLSQRSVENYLTRAYESLGLSGNNQARVKAAIMYLAEGHDPRIYQAALDYCHALSHQELAKRELDAARVSITKARENLEKASLEGIIYG